MKNNLLPLIMSIQNRINLEKVFGSGGKDIVDDVEVVSIGVKHTIAAAARALMDTTLDGFAEKNYTVDAGKKFIPIKLVIDKIGVTADKDINVDISETANAKGGVSLMEGEGHVEVDYPITEYEWAATKVVKLYMSSEAAVDLTAEVKLWGIVIDA